MRLILHRPLAPASIPPLFFGVSAAPEALVAMINGDAKRLDALELFAINLVGPYPILPDDAPESAMLDADGRELVFLADGLVRGRCFDGRTAIEWALVRPCLSCWRRPTQRAGCRRCGGIGHLSDCWDYVLTDLDGNLLPGEQWW